MRRGDFNNLSASQNLTSFKRRSPARIKESLSANTPTSLIPTIYEGLNVSGATGLVPSVSFPGAASQRTEHYLSGSPAYSAAT